MSVEKSIAIGIAANEMSKKITGTSEVSAGRTIVATASGGVAGAVAGGAIAIGVGAVGIAAAPLTVPLCIGGAAVACVASWFD